MYVLLLATFFLQNINEVLSVTVTCYYSYYNVYYECTNGCCGDNYDCCNTSSVGTTVGYVIGCLVVAGIIFVVVLVCLKKKGKCGRAINPSQNNTHVTVAHNPDVTVVHQPPPPGYQPSFTTHPVVQPNYAAGPPNYPPPQYPPPPPFGYGDSAYPPPPQPNY